MAKLKENKIKNPLGFNGHGPSPYGYPRKDHRYMKEYRKQNAEKIAKYFKNYPKRDASYLREWYKKNPWHQHYSQARNRCRDYNKYGKRGIKFLMTVSDFKFLWFRDKSYLLIRPSIDRIDSSGNYEMNNCRFIEYKDNLAREKWTGWRRWIACKTCRTNSKIHYAKGYCRNCFLKAKREGILE